MGYALSAQQTFAQTELPDLTRMDQYLYHLDTVRCELPPSVKYLTIDGAYAKENFVTGAVHQKLHVISKLRCDANLRWLYRTYLGSQLMDKRFSIKRMKQRLILTMA